jgi:IPT/TIG domain-containing protein
VTRSSGIWAHITLGILGILVGLSFPVMASEHLSIQSILPSAGVTSPGTKVKVLGTGFWPGAVVYFDGLQSRQTNFISPTELEVETPYLRPGIHFLQVVALNVTIRSSVEFMALPSESDAQIDKAIEIARQGNTDAAAAALEQIGQTNSDYQVRAAAYYEESQIFFNRGDLFNWRRASALIYLDSAKSGMAVQTYWRYGLAFANSLYLFDAEPKARFDLRMADNLITFDVTEDPEPRFYRALLNARSGNLAKAKIDSDFVSKAWPSKSSSAALAAYIAVLSGDTRPLHTMTSGPIPTDATSLALLGEGLFVSGDLASAKRFWSGAAEANPARTTMPCLAAKKHLNNGEKITAKVLLTECVAMASNSKEGQAARESLSHLDE